MRSGDLWVYDAALTRTGIALLADFIAGNALADGRLREVLVGWMLPQPTEQLLWVAGADDRLPGRTPVGMMDATVRRTRSAT